MQGGVVVDGDDAEIDAAACGAAAGNVDVAAHRVSLDRELVEFDFAGACTAARHADVAADRVVGENEMEVLGPGRRRCRVRS